MTDFRFRIENNILKGEEAPHPFSYASLGEFILKTLQETPDLVGEIDTVTGETYTYKKMQDRSVRCALWMKAAGLVSGDVVMICSNNQLDVAMPYFGALYLGAVVNPLDAGLSRREFEHMLHVTRPKLAFVAKEEASVIAAAAMDAKLDLEIVVFGKITGFLEFDSVITQPAVSEVANFELTPIEDPDATAVILCTSGTTGLSKGVALGHRVLGRQIHWVDELFVTKKMGVIFTSVSWKTGTLYLFSSLSSRMPRLIVPSFEEYSSCALIEKYKVKWAFMTPRMINRLLESKAMYEYDTSCLEQVVVGGTSLSHASREAFAKFVSRIQMAAGITEIGLFARQVTNSKPGSCGIIYTNCQLKVIDSSTGQILGVNQRGELLLKTASMMNSYYGNPQATAEAIDEKGWMHTGDFGYYDEDGEIFIIDRLKELIKFRGYHVLPSEIESLILTHPGVQDVAVVGQPHPQDGEHPIAFVVRRVNFGAFDNEVSEKELLDLVAAELSDSKRLRGGVRFIEHIPRTPTGKIQRRELRSLTKSTIIV